MNDNPRELRCQGGLSTALEKTAQRTSSLLEEWDTEAATLGLALNHTNYMCLFGIHQGVLGSRVGIPSRHVIHRPCRRPPSPCLPICPLPREYLTAGLRFTKLSLLVEAGQESSCHQSSHTKAGQGEGPQTARAVSGRAEI